MGTEPLNTGVIGRAHSVGGVEKVDQTMRKTKFGADFGVFQKLLEANTVVNSKVFGLSVEFARCLGLGLTDVGFQSGCSPGNEVHPAIFAPFRFVFNQKRKLHPS